MDSFLEKWREKRERNWNRRISQMAEEVYQIREHEGELWFTFNGYLFSPCSLLRAKDDDDCITVLKTLRKLYIERKTKTKD